MDLSTKDISSGVKSLSSSVNGIYWTMIFGIMALLAYSMFLLNEGRSDLKQMIADNQSVIKDNSEVIRQSISIQSRLDSKIDTLLSRK